MPKRAATRTASRQAERDRDSTPTPPQPSHEDPLCLALMQRRDSYHLPPTRGLELICLGSALENWKMTVWQSWGQRRQSWGVPLGGIETGLPLEDCLDGGLVVQRVPTGPLQCRGPRRTTLLHSDLHLRLCGESRGTARLRLARGLVALSCCLTSFLHPYGHYQHHSVAGAQSTVRSTFILFGLLSFWFGLCFFLNISLLLSSSCSSPSLSLSQSLFFPSLSLYLSLLSVFYHHVLIMIISSSIISSNIILLLILFCGLLFFCLVLSLSVLLFCLHPVWASLLSWF